MRRSAARSYAMWALFHGERAKSLVDAADGKANVRRTVGPFPGALRRVRGLVAEGVAVLSQEAAARIGGARPQTMLTEVQT
ncbi:hypothetical protein Hesp01_09990 [Herbidospora sp. NBRC 101105]|nr:hypothetical protein Hesp01_09990 [Herbidospora sp. NBRC 101105]